MVVYWDLAALVNGAADYLLLLSAARLAGRTVPRLRLLGAAAFGAAYAVLRLVLPCSPWLTAAAFVGMALLAFRDQLAARFPDDHIPSPDGYVCMALHTHLFRYFNGRSGAAELRRRLTTIQTLRDALEAVKAIDLPEIFIVSNVSTDEAAPAERAVVEADVS